MGKALTPTIPGLFDPRPQVPDVEFSEIAPATRPTLPPPAPVKPDFFDRMYLAINTIQLPGGWIVYRADLKPCHCGEGLFSVVLAEERSGRRSVQVQCPAYYDDGHRPDRRGRETIRLLGTLDVRRGIYTPIGGES